MIPYMLAENAGLSPISVVTELRKRHSEGEKNAGINVRKVGESSSSFKTCSHYCCSSNACREQLMIL